MPLTVFMFGPPVRNSLRTLLAHLYRRGGEWQKPAVVFLAKAAVTGQRGPYCGDGAWLARRMTSKMGL